MDNTREAIIGTTKLVRLRLFVKGDVTNDKDIINSDLLEIGGLGISKDGRGFWCDTHVTGALYNERNDETQVVMKLVNDPDSDPEISDELTEDDLFSNAEFYLWWECREEPTEQTLLVEMGIDKPSHLRTMHTINLN